jgi:hypothetical protein
MAKDSRRRRRRRFPSLSVVVVDLLYDEPGDPTEPGDPMKPGGHVEHG